MQLPEEVFLMFRERSRDSYMIRYQQVAETAFLLVDRKAFALQAHHRAVLRAGTHLQFHLPVERIHRDLAAQHSRVKVDGDIGIQVVVFPLEYRVIAHYERDVQVAVRTSVGTFPAMAFQLDDLPPHLQAP